MLERTFSIIKPDAVARNLTNAINGMITAAGLTVLESKEMQLTRDQAETFYAEHSSRGFFKDLVDYMISAPVAVQVLEGDNAIATYRTLMGATDPADAAEGTIRAAYGVDKGQNSVHGSDSAASAVREIGLFFPHLVPTDSNEH